MILQLKLQQTMNSRVSKKGEQRIMKRDQYEKTRDYKKAIKILKDFIEEELGGNIDAMRTFCFDDLTKFIGNIGDPDMYLIVQVIYIILWGDIYDLTFDKMGAWDLKGTYAFRGDTMNSFGSLFGKESETNEFGYRAKFFGADKDIILWNKIKEFSRLYHQIGNFIVIPNRSSAQNGINGARGCYYNTDYCEGMRDYFDWFLVAVEKYQNKVKNGDIKMNMFEMQLQQNPEYNPFFLEISQWKEIFFLKHYFENDKPKWLFNTPLERRLLITAELKNRKDEKYYQDQEYLELMNDYLDKSKEVIEYRTNRMVDVMKEKCKKQIVA